MIFEPISRKELLEQGECCGNGCSNCPYTPRNIKGSKEVVKTGVTLKAED